MKIIKRLLLLTLVVTGAAAGAYVYLNKYHPDLIWGKELKKLVEENNLPGGNVLGTFFEENKNALTSTDEKGDSNKNNSFSLQNTLDLTGAQLEVLKNKSIEVKDQLGEAVSEIKESSQSTPLHEKAFEYGQYIYCQQVIKEYENL